MLELHVANRGEIIKVKGDIREEFITRDIPSLLVFSDGTVLRLVPYGTGVLAVWKIFVVKWGPSFDLVYKRYNKKEERYLYTAKFFDGIEWIYFANNPVKVRRNNGTGS